MLISYAPLLPLSDDFHIFQPPYSMLDVIQSFYRPAERRFRILGFAFFQRNSSVQSGVFIEPGFADFLWPCWVLALLTAAPPAIWMIRRNRPRVTPGLCTVCGYDLRATPNQCSECGTVRNKGKA
jgi:hypothetical protein